MCWQWVLTQAEQPHHNCCLFTMREKGGKVILSLVGLRKMEMGVSLADAEIQEFVLRLSKHYKENGTSC